MAAERAGSCDGAQLDEVLAEVVGPIAASEVTPIDDVCSTAAYRRFASACTVRRILRDA